VAGVDESDRYEDSVVGACGEDGVEEIADPGEYWVYKSLSREVDADVCEPERFVPNFGCEWDRRKDGEK
jgi:hypothetical protein